MFRVKLCAAAAVVCGCAVYVCILLACNALVYSAWAAGESDATSGANSLPRQVRFSGSLADAVGAALTGAQGVTFSLYAEQTGGAPLWLETQNVEADAQGRYSVLLGSMREDGLPQDVFTSNEARWLGVQANQPGAVEQARVLLVSVPYALKAADAETLGGKPVTAFLLAPSADGAQTRDREGAEAVAKNDGLPTASVAVANRLVKYTDGAGAMDSSNVTDDGTNVGIGSPSTGAKLHIAGSVPGTATSDLLSLSTTDGAIRSEITARGLQFWRFNNGVDNAGQIAFATPGGSPGIVMWTGPTFDQNRFDIANYGSVFSLGFNADSGGQVLNIKPGGNVGIGTAAPTAKLDIVGDLKVSGNLALPNTASANSGVITLGGERFAHSFGGNNTFLGNYAGNFTMTGIDNTASGNQALSLNTTGSANTISGAFAMLSNTTGNGNTATGASAMFSNTSGSNNTASGVLALYSNLDGADNTANGLRALFSNTSGSNNTASGVHALEDNTTGYNNTATGVVALGANTTGYNNTATGLAALVGNSTGFNNTASGVNALWMNSTGSDNTGVGAFSLNDNTTGISNTAGGAEALSNNTTGNLNTALGNRALIDNTTGSNNTGIGFEALGSSTGSNNTALGLQALWVSLTGNNNTAVGKEAGRTTVLANANRSGSNNTFLGYESGPGVNGTTTPLNNATAIGANAVVNASNAMVLGSINGINGAASGVNVGIGTATPTAKLEVVGDVKVSGGGKFVGDGSGLTGLPGGGSFLVTGALNFTTTARYGGLNGDGAEDFINDANTPVALAGTLSAMRVRLSVAPGAGQNVVVKVYKNSVAQTMTCTINDPGKTCLINGTTATFAAGDDFAVETLGSAGAVFGRVTWSAVFTP